MPMSGPTLTISIVRLERLPGWIVDDETSVREEVADYVGQAPERLWEMTRMCAKTAAWSLGFHSDRESLLSHRDPLPQSTVDALARLSRTAGGRRP